MKKFLLSCCLALGIGANAQITYNGDFEDAGTPGYSTTLYGQFGGGSRTAAAACNGAYGGQLAISATYAQTGYMVILNNITGQTNNGQAVTVTAGYKKAAGAVGTLSIAYMVQDPATQSWSVYPVGTAASLTSAAVTTCSTLSATIPSGALQPGQTTAIGVWFVRSSGSGNVYVDDINFQQATVTTAPSCTTLTSPANESTVSAGNSVFTWPTVATAVNYKLSIGTTPGGSDVLNTTVAGNSLNVSLPTNSTLYAKVTPTNSNGDATGCTEITFNTNSTISYCGPITASATVYPISSVTFNGTTKTSAATTGGPAYEDYTSTVFNATVGTSYPISVTGTGAAGNRFGMTVFVDWNGDGDFNDSSEQYFTTSPFVGNNIATNVLTGNILIPANATAGNKRMRIKYNFNSSATAIIPALSDPCGNMGNGQVEDYTISVTIPTTAPACATLTTPANGATNVTPNPAVLTWNSVEGASGYKLYIGTTSGGTDIANGTLVSTPTYSTVLASNITYYVKIVPTNSIGDATGCTETSFTTGAAAYCTASATNTSTSFEKIANVTFADINNTSTVFTGYSDYTSITGNVTKGNAYTFTATGNVNAWTSDIVLVWIDYNKDGVFDNTTELVLTSAIGVGPWTGSITIPTGAATGTTRMRVRLSDSSTGHNALPCGTSTYGEVEDYTLNITGPTMAVSDLSKSNLSIYPNPFTDVLKISDIRGVKSISVNDMSGRQVKSLAPTAEINLSNLKEGLYIVNLQMEDGSVKSFKAIKK
ncbi:hypothetical protein J2X97_002207 [Epilithonimonas hungarica]|uniref:GEVED domain-containing protein n=1 Tax=Epilithonimonas hungarica TaxID=454006 RepID=UPI00278AA3D8|nr:GEVED domain-containing protein [Epilithonimonas hungarica]MDP9956548.1 hypothetical protein [Epilithonimonas hungarica]